MSAQAQRDGSEGTGTDLLPSGSSGRRRVAFALAGALVLLLSWPGCEGAVRFPDTAEYMRWPEPVSTDGYSRLGPRMPAYAVTLHAVGTGPLLVHLQVAVSLLGWGWLGWQLAGATGALLACLMLLAPEMRVWQLAALTESLTFSMLAALVAGGLSLGRHWRWGVAAGWAVGLAFFGLLRPSNAAVVPFLLGPLLPQLHDLRHFRPLRAGLAESPGRFLAAVALAGCVVLAGIALAERSEFWRTNYTTALMERVITDAEAREFFGDAGMPRPVVFSSPAFAEWFDAHARSTYQRWVVTRAASYDDAWWWLRPDWQREAILDRYGAVAGAERLASPVWLPASALYRLTSPPRAIWLGVLVLTLAWTIVRGGIGVYAASALVLAAGAYVQSFLAFHASAAEEVRHTLGASMLYRIAFVLALRSLWDCAAAWLRGR